MSISIDKLLHRSNTIQPLKNNSRKSTAEVVEKKFDEVMISSSASQIKEKKITEALEGKVISQIQTQPSKDDIEALKKTVGDGTYMIRPEDIASKIILERGAY